MKKIYLTLGFIAAFIYTAAQDESESYRGGEEFKTIFGGKSVGGYGGFGVGYAIVDDKSSVEFDARGGIIIGHWFAMGIGGGAFLSPYEYNTAYSTDLSLSGGYGGFFGEIILLPKSLIHLSFPVLIGMGGAAISTKYNPDSGGDVSYYIEETSIFTVIEPSVELEFNFTKFFRMSGFLSYRFTTDLEFDNTYEISPDALVNYTAGLRFKFGKF
jgi:hypothetical protein